MKAVPEFHGVGRTDAPHTVDGRLSHARRRDVDGGNGSNPGRASELLDVDLERRCHVGHVIGRRTRQTRASGPTDLLIRTCRGPALANGEKSPRVYRRLDEMPAVSSSGGPPADPLRALESTRHVEGVPFLDGQFAYLRLARTRQVIL